MQIRSYTGLFIKHCIFFAAIALPILLASNSVASERLFGFPSVAFFVVAYVLALHPGRLTRLLGRVTGPALIALIVVVVASARASVMSGLRCASAMRRFWRINPTETTPIPASNNPMNHTQAQSFRF